jgi:hypothetical protein
LIEPRNLILLLTLYPSAAPVDWDSLDWQAMGIDWSSAWAAGQKTATSAPAPVATPATTAAAQPAATTPAAAPAPATTHASAPAGGVFQEVASLFEGLVGVANGRTSFGGVTAPSGSLGDNYIGNVGNPYGSNVILVDDASSYQYTNTFTNTQLKTITVNVWQKVGPDMRPLSGSALAPTKTTLTFTLLPGQSKTVAFDENTQVGWAEATSATTAAGSFDTTWGEANFVSTGCGYDVSAIMNSNDNNYDMTITSLEAPACVSSRTENMWLTATNPVGTSDGSCFIFQGKATLSTVMGGFI